MNEHTDFFVGWETLSLINAGLAQSKNRSGLAWWLASLFVRCPYSEAARLDEAFTAILIPTLRKLANYFVPTLIGACVTTTI